MDEADEKRRAELRKAGQAYFDKVLAQASTGHDPFTPAASKATISKATDPDLAAVGSALEQALFGISLIIFLACSSTAMVFCKLALTILPAPCTILVLHMLPISLAALIAANYGLLNSQPPTLKGARSALPYSVFHGGMALMVLFALEHMRVETVLGVTAAVAPFVGSYLCNALADPSKPHTELSSSQIAVVVLGFISSVICIAAEGPNTMSAAYWLFPWFALLAMERACDAAKTPGVVVTAESIGWRWRARQQILKLLVQLEGLTPDVEDGALPAPGELGTVETLLYCNALPLLPVAILAALLQEGSIFTDLELHVHSVSLLGYSVLASVGAALAGVVLRERMSSQNFSLTTILTQLTALVISIWGRDDVLVVEGLVSSVVCVLAGSAFKDWLQ
ncbi:hypothetical protein CYMTET_48594 [Cymbomonas tetramitiformis]|uniref:Uncharacterized protein n=1 Tax=Cymbomonas tetramitiformis TaxID=36881 RepID=A0AAE0BTT2_9CHLO|nr:hypothetical protein CYMTET_48594 [Cymbomonas tetramitiformis]